MLRTAAIDQLTDTTPKIAGLMDRLEAAGRAARSVFTKEDVDRIVENRLLRERSTAAMESLSATARSAGYSSKSATSWRTSSRPCAPARATRIAPKRLRGVPEVA